MKTMKVIMMCNTCRGEYPTADVVKGRHEKCLSEMY